MSNESQNPTRACDLSPFLADEEVEYARLLALAHADGEAVMWEDIARRGVEGMKRLAASLAAATMRAEAAERALANIRGVFEQSDSSYWADAVLQAVRENVYGK